MFGKMDLRRRRETSYNGVSIAVLKSALQKYARRGQLDQGLWCLAEVDLFSLVEAGASEPADVRRAMALRTNLLNRLIVMVPEEVAIAAWWMPPVAHRLAEAWKASRRSDTARKPLVDLYAHLTAARKVRLVSDIKSVYLLPPDHVDPARLTDLRTLHADLVRTLGLGGLYDGCDAEPEDVLDKCGVDLRAYGVRDEEVRRIFNGVLHHLARESDHAFWWLARLIDRGRDPDGEPRLQGKQNPIQGVWRLLEAFAVKGEALWGTRPVERHAHFGRLGEVVRVLHRWFDTMTHREKPTYLYHALLLAVRRGQVD
jgi:hypothetical protein